MSSILSFAPRGVLRNPHVQSLLASLEPRRGWVRLHSKRFRRLAQASLVNAGGGVRLQGFFCPADSQPAKGLAILLHGWEGSSSSTYVLSLGHYLWSRGHDVFRLNFRDHGDSCHLNQELFHSCRLDEVVSAVRVITETHRARPLFIVGFSLGGNFALRVALRAKAAGVPVAHVVAASPVIDPAHVLDVMERSPLYERYFAFKWRRSLARKQRAFPAVYEFGEWMRLRRLREMTSHLVERHTDFPSLDDYLRGYSISGTALAGLSVPATIISAADDPIIPVADLGVLARAPCLTLAISPHGGHCGFIDRLSGESWLDRRIESVLQEAAACWR